MLLVPADNSSHNVINSHLLHIIVISVSTMVNSEYDADDDDDDDDDDAGNDQTSVAATLLQQTSALSIIIQSNNTQHLIYIYSL